MKKERAMTKIYEDDDRAVYIDKAKKSVIEKDKRTGETHFNRELKEDEWSRFTSDSTDSPDGSKD